MSVTGVSHRQRVLQYGFGGLALLFVGLAVVGGLRAYSPVPFWDMWDGYLPFLDQVESNGWAAWWRQHNEHRIVLSRLLFWADLRWFDGLGWFLEIVNYLLVALGAVLFCRLLREVPAPAQREYEQRTLGAVVVLCLFFWSQDENLTWGFQSQFILAQLLPLAALYALYRSMHSGTPMFALACLLGVCSAGTMANGILALPLMVAYAALTRQGMRRTVVLAALAALVLFAYFYDYASSGSHMSLFQVVRERPEQFVRYVLIYLGGPFNFMAGAGKLGKVAAQVAGLFFVISAIRFAWSNLRQGRHAALPLVLLFFIAYIIGTAIGTATGRITLGSGQALSPRYTTPALMAWVALLLLYSPALFRLEGMRRRLAWGFLALLSLLMLAFQLRALKSRQDEVFGRAVGALAIELHINDLTEIGHVYPSTGVIATSAPAVDRGRSVFGSYPYRGVREQMGTVLAPLVLPACQGAIVTVAPVDGDARFLRVSGWLYEPAGNTVPQTVRFLDGGGKQVGYALGGNREPALMATAAVREAGYRGYLWSTPHGPELTLRGEGLHGPICQMQVKALASN